MTTGDAGITRYVASGVALALLAVLIMLPGSVPAGPPCPRSALFLPGLAESVTPLRVSRLGPSPPMPASPCPSGPTKFTYLGGSGGESGVGVAYDAAGNLIVGGWTTSANFPTTPGAYDTTPSAGGDAFIAKFDADATTLIAATLVGGSAYEYVGAMAVDGAGNIYLTGQTESADFPTTPGAYDNSLAGNRDFFLVKVDPTLSTLLYSTYLGGTPGTYDSVYGLAVDASGNAYLTGLAYSPDFPVTAGAYDTSLGDSQGDAFVTKINPASGGSADLVYSTFLGGGAEDMGRSIVVDSSGNAYVAGRTYSPDFPTTGGAFDTSNSLWADAFVTKLNPSGTGLVYSTFLGGNRNDDAWGIAIDGAGNAYVTGRTWNSDFPTTPGAFDTTFNGKPGKSTPSDAYVAKLNPAGSGLVYSTFLGGNAEDLGRRIIVDTDGSAYVVGYTYSSAYPVTADGFDTSYNGNRDAFLTRLNAAGSALVYSTYLGGTADDEGRSLAVDSLGNVYLTGDTQSTNFPVSSGAYDTAYNGNRTVFAGRMA